MSNVALVRDVLDSQHPMHGLLGRVLERAGGEDYILEWAEDHPGQFIKLLVANCVPAVQPQSGVQGDINITINEVLQPTSLDSVTIDEQGRVIEPPK